MRAMALREGGPQPWTFRDALACELATVPSKQNLVPANEPSHPTLGSLYIAVLYIRLPGHTHVVTGSSIAQSL